MDACSKNTDTSVQRGHDFILSVCTCVLVWTELKQLELNLHLPARAGPCVQTAANVCLKNAEVVVMISFLKSHLLVLAQAQNQHTKLPMT